MSSLLSSIIGGGNLLNILAGNGSLKISYSIYSTDFEMMTKAMHSVPNIHRKRFEFIAHEAWRKVTNRNEKLFWQAVYFGCQSNIEQE